jgi:hypothetical protein
MDPMDFTSLFSGLNDANRPIRLRLTSKRRVFDNVLLVTRVSGVETLSGGVEYRMSCVATSAAADCDSPTQSRRRPNRGKVRRVFRTAGYDHQGSYKDRHMLTLIHHLIVKIVQEAK